MTSPSATARDFPQNTCPASRHAEMIAHQLESGRVASILDDPGHAAGSIRSVVESLWQARADLNRIGAALLGEAKDDASWWADAEKVVTAALQRQAGEREGEPKPNARRDTRVLDFLRYLDAQGGKVSSDDRHLDRWEDDRGEPMPPLDTINLAFEAGLADQVGEPCNWTIVLTPAGARAIGVEPALPTVSSQSGEG